MTIGQKIKFFRKRAGLSQQQLELAIDASFGSISRIENDDTNPTKETLELISHALELRPDEKSYLSGAPFMEISQNDIDNTISRHINLLKQDKFPVLLNNYKSELLAWNDKFREIWGVSKEEEVQFKGKIILELIFETSFRFSNVLSNELWEYLALKQLIGLYNDVGYMQDELWFKNLINKISIHPRFYEMWSKSKLIIDKNDGYLIDTIKLLDEKGFMDFRVVNLRDHNDPRFIITEYIN